MTSKTCAHCKYWTGGPKGPFRQCTRHAPSQTKSVDVQGDGVRIERAVWPWTKDVESCGEWTGKAEEVLEEIDQRFRRAQSLHDEYEGLERGSAGSNSQAEIGAFEAAQKRKWWPFYWSWFR